MNDKYFERTNFSSEEKLFIVTAGSSYLDVDAYACMIAMADLLRLLGVRAFAYSCAPCNYSIPAFLRCDSALLDSLPCGRESSEFKYVIVDVSDPAYIDPSIATEKIVGIYDHHVGFEKYWSDLIGDNSCIEFIGAAATLVYREWKSRGLLSEMSHSTASLLIAAILDNTLGLTSSNTTQEDREAFYSLCDIAKVGKAWCDSYFEAVSESIEADLKNALLGDIKTVEGNFALPPVFSQLCIWDARRVILKLSEIKEWFSVFFDGWLINLIDIKDHCSYFICNDPSRCEMLEKIFGVSFSADLAKSPVPYLRKEIIKKIKTYYND